MIRLTRSRNDDLVRVSFVLPLDDAPDAVSVVGDFNDWTPGAHPLHRRSNGTRSVTIELPRGSVVEYKYLAADGRWFTDPTAEDLRANEWGEHNARLEL